MKENNRPKYNFTLFGLLLSVVIAACIDMGIKGNTEGAVISPLPPAPTMIQVSGVLEEMEMIQSTLPTSYIRIEKKYVFRVRNFERIDRGDLVVPIGAILILRTGSPEIKVMNIGDTIHAVCEIEIDPALSLNMCEFHSVITGLPMPVPENVPVATPRRLKAIPPHLRGCSVPLIKVPQANPK